MKNTKVQTLIIPIQEYIAQVKNCVLVLGGSTLFTKSFTMELKVNKKKGKQLGEEKLEETDYKRTDILRLEVDPSNIK